MTSDSKPPKPPISVRESVGTRPRPISLVQGSEGEEPSSVRSGSTPVGQAGEKGESGAGTSAASHHTEPDLPSLAWTFERNEERWKVTEAGSTLTGRRGDEGVTIRLLHFQPEEGGATLELPWAGSHPDGLFPEEWVQLLDRARRPSPPPTPRERRRERGEGRPGRGN
ncbi:MAG: hypothetical protein WEA09_08050 [Gemmatimonadota bacterium]